MRANRFLCLFGGTATVFGLLLIGNPANGRLQRVDAEEADRITGGQVIEICGSNIVTTGVDCRGTVYVQGKGVESCNETIPEWKFGTQKGKWYGLNSRGCVTPGCGAYCGWYTPTGQTGNDCSQSGS